MHFQSESHISQSWAILRRHAREDIKPLRLQQLCRDNERVSAMVSVYNTTFQHFSVIDTHPETENRMIVLDLSRQRMTHDTLQHLLRLSTAKNLRGFMTELSWGQNDPAKPFQSDKKKREENGVFRNHPTVQTEYVWNRSLHMALRVPAGKDHSILLADGSNVLDSIHDEWQRIKRLSNVIRRGQTRGVSGNMFRDVVVIGPNLSALQFIATAFHYDERAVIASRVGLSEGTAAARLRNLTGISETGSRKLHFLTSVDPLIISSLLEDLDPGGTLVVSVALNGSEETGIATKALKSWLLHHLGQHRESDLVLERHMMLITANEGISSVIDKPDSVHLVPEYCCFEPFTSCTVVTILPLAIVYGWSTVEEFLAGAHDIDTHFQDTCPRHNLPVLLALVDIWNEILLEAPCRVVTPFGEALSKYTPFVASIEAQACSRREKKSGPRKTTASKQNPKKELAGCALVVDGGSRGTYDRSLFQGKSIVNTEVVAMVDSQLQFNTNHLSGVHSHKNAQDALMCSVLAQCDELAFGSARTAVGGHPLSTSTYSMTSASTKGVPDGEKSEGNRPNTLLLCGKLDAFTCGQLIALAEHRVAVKAHLCDLDPLVRESGSALRLYRTNLLQEELHNVRNKNDENSDQDDQTRIATRSQISLSTKTILEHYAMQMS